MDEPAAHAWLIFGGVAYNQGLPQPGELGAPALFQHVFFNDLHRLDLATMTWAAVATRGAVPRRRAQALAVATDDEQLLIVFGGACHSEHDPGRTDAMIVELDDICLLHLPTATWLPPRAVDPPANPKQRGGLNTLVRHPATRSLHVFGGMNSKEPRRAPEGQDLPDFLATMSELVGVQAD